jgi:hypothetical protein
MPAIGKRRSRMWSALRLTDAELDALERFTEVWLAAQYTEYQGGVGK